MSTVPEPFELPPDFLLGSATASLQIEGGDTNNTWYEWCHLGKIKDGSTCDLADDHWNRYKQDIALIKKMNHQVYRLSLEWARIEPEMGQFDASVIEHYRDEIQELVKADIRPLVTLHHFSNPLWLERMGGWLNTESVGLFERYAQFAAYHLGDLVSDWVTINEPNVYLYFGYVLGIWPPGHKK